jgi:hypothetical protein
VLEGISPFGVQASLLALEQLAQQRSQRCEVLKKRWEHLEYETTRAFEQYNEVDPRNRLVASELERRWNAKLEQSTLARAALDAELASHRQIDEPTRERIGQLGSHFHEVWNHPHCSEEIKKKILRIVLQEVIVSRKTSGLELILHWTGGVHTSLCLPSSTSPSVRRTREQALEILRRLAPNYDDASIAGVLNRNQIPTATGFKWTQGRVATIRRSHRIEGGSSRSRPGILNLHQAARTYNVTHHILRRLIRQGLVRNYQTVPLAPLELSQADLDSEPVQDLLRHHKNHHRFPQGGGNENQINLFA